jgi:hypothetical protein
MPQQLRSPLFLVIALAAASPVFGQGQPPSAGWSGWARCQVNVQGPGYSDQQTHTWTLTGGTPTVEGAFRVYPGTWSVVGSGSLQRSQGTQTLTAQWATNGAPMNGPIAVFVRASDGRMFIQARHAQLRAAGAIQGYQQVTIDGKQQTPGKVAVEAFEWAFPLVEVSPSATTATGSSAPAVTGSVGPMQPAGSSATASCTWQFGQGSAAPAPLPALAAQAVPTPPLAGGAAQPPATTSAVPVTPVAPVTTTSPPTQASSSTPPTPTGASPPQPTAVIAPNAPVNALPGTAPGGGGLSAIPSPGGVTPSTPRDPAKFTARQTADGTVLLTWEAVAGAGSYMLGGPGTNVGITVTGTSHTVTGLPQGNHTWTVASLYSPGGILTTSDRWSKATTTVTNQSGRYRAVILGFRVKRPTFDERINGNGDEVYAAAGVTTIDRRDESVLQSWTIIKSESYGDVGRNPGYVRAGSFGATGGLKAGDVVPAGGDPRMTSGSPSATRFPLVVWEGVLRDGIDAVIVKPTLWEVDGQLQYYSQWANPTHSGRAHPQLRAEQAAAVKEKATQGDLTPFRGVIVFNCANADLLQADCSPGDDRPIGINQNSCIGNPRGLAWCDVTIVLTREGIERALSSSYQVDGVPPGVITIPLTEPEGVDAVRGGLDGNYELYVRVERMP